MFIGSKANFVTALRAVTNQVWVRRQSGRENLPRSGTNAVKWTQYVLSVAILEKFKEQQREGSWLRTTKACLAFATQTAVHRRQVLAKTLANGGEPAKLIAIASSARGFHGFRRSLAWRPSCRCAERGRLLGGGHSRIPNSRRCGVYGTRKRPLEPWTRLSLTRRELICACAGSFAQCDGSVELPFSRLDRQELMARSPRLPSICFSARHSMSRSRERRCAPNPERSWRT
jgi:hypothetical protein